MTERPILFNAPMVRAILKGQKTQTRRIVKLRKDVGFGCLLRPNEIAGEINSGQYENSVFGQPGDRLWVRENGWERPARSPKMMREGADTWEPYYFDADGYTDLEHEQFKQWGFKRRPSIHMPRWGSRILLEITSVRVELLQGISEKDAISEGIYSDKVSEPLLNSASQVDKWYGPQWAFKRLWESINGSGSWDTTSWVWVVEFKVVKQ